LSPGKSSARLEHVSWQSQAKYDVMSIVSKAGQDENAASCATVDDSLSEFSGAHFIVLSDVKLRAKYPKSGAFTISRLVTTTEFTTPGLRRRCIKNRLRVPKSAYTASVGNLSHSNRHISVGNEARVLKEGEDAVRISVNEGVT